MFFKLCDIISMIHDIPAETFNVQDGFVIDADVAAHSSSHLCSYL